MEQLSLKTTDHHEYQHTDSYVKRNVQMIHGDTNIRSNHQSHDSHESEGWNNDGPQFSPEDGFLHLTSHVPPPPMSYQVDSFVI